MTDTRPLARLLRHRPGLLLDFDGPIAHVFAGRPAETIAAELRDVLAEHGHPTDTLADERDPLAVYRCVAGQPALARVLSQQLTTAEVDAVRTATPTFGAHDVIRAARAGGWRVAIVSNNSAAAIAVYLARHGLTEGVEHVAARRAAEPRLMKPNPHYLTEGAQALGLPPAACTLVGDSTTDIEAAHATSAATIGYANKPGKTDQLAAADAIITSMAELRDALAAGRTTWT